MACYGRALELDPTSAEALSSRARMLEEIGRTDEARRDREKALSIVNRAIEADGSDTWSYYQRADLLRGLGRRQEAIEHLERCLALGIDDPLIDLVKYIVQRLRRELASSLAEQGESIERFSPGVKRYFSQIGNAMAVWVDVCKKIMSHE